LKIHYPYYTIARGEQQENMKHIIFYSGGIGSWMTAKRVIDKEGKENAVLLFTDTLIEDEDLYRFLKETSRGFRDTTYSYSRGPNPLGSIQRC
jgi:hypothetical protein